VDFLQKLYRNGGDACELLRLVSENFQLDDGWSIISYVEQLRRQKSELAQLYGITAARNTDADRLHYETEITQHDEAIYRAEKLALNDLKRKLSDGVFYGLGYPSPNANLRLIPLKEWAFLELDIDRSTATFQEIAYAGIRFISCSFFEKELRALSDKEIEDFRSYFDANRPQPKPLNRDESINKDDKEKLKSQKQVDAILEAIKLKKWEPMSIPDGGKGIIQKICEGDHPSIFDQQYSFDEAWKAGRKRQLFRMENHASYAKRGQK
jgi:hypothetical protein